VGQRRHGGFLNQNCRDRQRGWVRYGSGWANQRSGADGPRRVGTGHPTGSLVLFPAQSFSAWISPVYIRKIKVPPAPSDAALKVPGLRARLHACAGGVRAFLATSARLSSAGGGTEVIPVPSVRATISKVPLSARTVSASTLPSACIMPPIVVVVPPAVLPSGFVEPSTLMSTPPLPSGRSRRNGTRKRHRRARKACFRC
jgi:hypothetical protein